MSRTYVYSDPHFDHANILKFTNYDGTRVRPLWDDVKDMNAEMIQWYNEVVNDEDRVYILGDVAFTRARMNNFVSQLKGRKCLVPGNHDPRKIKQYIDVFDDVAGYIQRNGFIMSHIPLHPGSLGRWKLNIHGHLHSNTVKLGNWNDNQDSSKLEDDPRYYCACVERTNYRPILLDQILEERGLK